MSNYIHLPQYPLNGTQLECDGSELRPDGTCAKCERVNERIASHFATSSDIAERALRAVEKLRQANILLADPTEAELAEATDIIAAEFEGEIGGTTK